MFDKKTNLKLVILGLLVSMTTGLVVAALYETHPREKVIFKESAGYYPAVYCARDIPANTVITRADLVVKMVRECRLPANGCDCIYVPLGRKLSDSLKKGEYISYNWFGIGRTMADNRGPNQVGPEPPIIIEP